MFRTLNKRLPLIAVTFGILFYMLANGAHAGDTEQAEYDKGFGAKDAAVRASRNPKKIAEFAGELLESAKLVREDQPYQAYLFDKTYELGMLFPEGIPFAVEAMDQLGKTQPQLKAAADANLLNAMQRRYQTSGGSEHIAAASAYIDWALQIADSLAADGKFDEAVIICDKAKTALAASAARHNDVMERAIVFKEEENAAKRIASLKATLKNTPHDAIASGELVQILMLDTDTPDQALAYVDATGDTRLKKIIVLAAKEIATLTDTESLELADWYRGQTTKGGKLASYTAWSRAKLCYQHFLDAHPKSDADHLNTTRAIKDAEVALEKLPATSFQSKKWATSVPAAGLPNVSVPTGALANTSGLVDLLPLIDPADDALVGTWTIDKDGLRLGAGRVRIPYSPPDEYDFIVEFTRTALPKGGISPVCLDCAKGDRAFGLQVGYWGFGIGHRSAAIQGIHLPPGKANPTDCPEYVAVIGKRERAVVEVRRSQIKFTIGDKSVIYPTNYSEISWQDGHWFSVGQDVLGVASYSGVVFHKIQVREVTGHGRRTARLAPKFIGVSDDTMFAMQDSRTLSLVKLEPVGLLTDSRDPSIQTSNPQGSRVVVDGSTCNRFLYVPSPSSVAYAIPAGATGFRAVGTQLIPPAGNPQHLHFDGNIRFQVFVDGNEVYESHPLAKNQGQINIAVAIPQGSRRIELSAMSSNQAVWAKPEFVFFAAAGGTAQARPASAPTDLSSAAIVYLRGVGVTVGRRGGDYIFHQPVPTSEWAHVLAITEDALDISFTDVAGTDEAVTQIAKLSRLKTLGLEQQPVTDAGIAALAHHPALEEINLRQTRVTGECITHLAHIQFISRIVLRETSIRGPVLRPLLQCRRLLLLDLAGNPLNDQEIADLAGHPTLESINLGHTKVSGACANTLLSMISLHEVTFFEDHIDDECVIKLSRHPNIEILGIARCDFGHAAIAALPNLKSLQKLELGAHQGYSIDDIANLSLCKNIQKLGLGDGSDFGDKEIEALTGLEKLEQLDLRGSQVTDKGLRAAVPRFPHLKFVAAGELITQNTIDELKQKYPTLSIKKQ